MATTYHFRSDDPVFKTPEERRAYALRTTTEHPVCAQCGQRHAPKATVTKPDTDRRASTATTREQRTALTVPAPPKPVVHKTHEQWCKHYGVPDWKRQMDAPPSLIERARQAMQRTLYTPEPVATNASGVPAPPSLLDALRAARGGQR